MADNDAPAASRATTLSTLPLEIKARICELAALQDEGYKERWIPGAPGEKLVEVHKNEWRGRSLAALSETSKEFNELAAKHIFHTLTDTQIDSLEFSLVVIPRHASRVRRVVIKRPGTSLGRQVACQRVFAALLGLPNLTDLHASYDPTSNALGGFGTALGTPSGATGQIRNAFRAVALRLRTVAIVNFPSADATLSFLEMCKNVQNLKIMGRVIIEDEKLLSEYLGAHPTLERLTLDATTSGSTGLHLGPEWSLPSTWTRTLSILDLINIELDASSVSLVNQHAATLRHLSLRLPTSSDPVHPVPLPDFPHFIQLPILSSFTIENTSSKSFEAIAAAIAKATSNSKPNSSSRLTSLIVELKDGGRLIPPKGLKDALIPFERHIQHLCVTGPNGKMLSNNVIGAMTFFETEQVLSSRSSRRDPFLQRKPTASTQESLSLALKVRHRAIDEALAYGGRLAQQFRDEESLEGMEIMLNSLGDIWGHKLLRDD